MPFPTRYFLTAVIATQTAALGCFHRSAVNNCGTWFGAEMELSALSRQCLSRRIADIETLSGELESIVKERNRLAIKFKWQFTIENAGEKLSRHYEKVALKTFVTKHQ